MSSAVKIFAPATVANLACGFDAIGLAIHDIGDALIGKLLSHAGIQIVEITGAQGKISTDPTKNTAGIAAQAVLDALGAQKQGIELRLHKKLPIGSGMGSSAASAVAGAFLVNVLLGSPLSKHELLVHALEGEAFASGAKHADNVAPCLLGGIQLIRDNASLDVHRVYAPRGLHVVIVCPKVQMLTKTARGILSPTVDLKAHIAQSANLATMILALQNSDFDLLSRTLEDQIIEKQRAHLIPYFYEVKAAALAAGALGSSISGAGPSIFALCRNSLQAENTAAAMSKVFSDNKMRHRSYVSEINHEGCILC